MIYSEFRTAEWVLAVNSVSHGFTWFIALLNTLHSVKYIILKYIIFISTLYKRMLMCLLIGPRSKNVEITV